MLLLQNNLPVHISPPGTFHSTFHACSHQQYLFLQPQSSERTLPSDPPHNGNLSELLNENICPFSQNPKVIIAEWLGFGHLLHMSDTRRLSYLSSFHLHKMRYCHSLFTGGETESLRDEVTRSKPQSYERQNLALNLQWGQVQCTALILHCVDILSRDIANNHVHDNYSFLWLPLLSSSKS